MLHLTTEDAALVKILRALKVLQDIDRGRLSQVTKTGTAAVFCSDGDHAHDIFSFHCQSTACNRHHPIAAAGGAIAGIFSKNENFLDEVQIAVTAKKIHVVAIIAHAPCAKAYGEKLDLYQVLDLLVSKKRMIKNHSFEKADESEITVILFLHVAYGNNRKRTYFVDRTKWVQYATENPR